MTQDYLNALPEAEGMSTVTPLTSFMEPLRALKPHRQTQLMAIINLTPDSFSGGRDLSSLDPTVSEVLTAVKYPRVSIIDIGGQSSAPGAPDITAMEEISRVVPLVQRLNEDRDRKYAISIDTYRAAVAEAAIAAGADIINNITPDPQDPEMLSTVARSGKTICIMHMRGQPSTMTTLTDYYPNGLIPTIASELLSRIADAERPVAGTMMR